MSGWMNLILPGAEEGMRAAAPAARKPTCLRRPVIGADVEFGNAVPSEAKGRICVNPREFNANLKGRTAQAQVFPFAECGSPSIYFLFFLFLRLLLLRFR